MWMILSARALLLDSRLWVEGGGLLIASGKITHILRSRRAVARARTAHGGRFIELGELVLTPGLVNAHCHLELGRLLGRLPAGSGFVGWIQALIAARATLRTPDFDQGVRTGARSLLARGTTTVGDVDASGAAVRLAGRLGIRTVVYREILDAWDGERTRSALSAVRTGMPRQSLASEGLSPHAPYTTSSSLLAGARAIARRRRLALTVHWAETEEERKWLESGTGELARLLPASPRRRGLELLAQAGLLGPRTSLVHGNWPWPGEPEELARRHVTLVHCPGTHAFFARSPFPLERYLRAGVRLALGTDSLASNGALDMTREMALLRAGFPRLAPASVFDMASENGAMALGLGHGIGRLMAHGVADLAAWSLAACTHAEALEELTAGTPPLARVFVAGKEPTPDPREGVL